MSERSTPPSDIQSLQFSYDPQTRELIRNKVSVVLSEAEARWLPLLLTALKDKKSYVSKEELERALGTNAPHLDKYVSQFNTDKERAGVILGIKVRSRRGVGRYLEIEPRPAANASKRSVLKVGLWWNQEDAFDEAVAAAFQHAFDLSWQKKFSGSEVSFHVAEKPRVGDSATEMAKSLDWFREEQVVAVVGPMGSKSAFLLLEKELLRDTDPVVLSPSASSAKLCVKPYFHPRFYRCRNSDRPAIAELAEWIKQVHGNHKLVALVDKAANGLKGFGRQNWEVFRTLVDENVAIELFEYPEFEAKRVYQEWAEYLKQKQPQAIVMFGHGVDLAPLSYHAQRELKKAIPKVILYTIDPKRRGFIEPDKEDSSIPSNHPIEGLRAVVESTFPSDNGAPLRVRSFRNRWEKIEKEPWNYNHGLCGHDTAHILTAAFARLPNLSDASTVRGLLPDALNTRDVCEGALLSPGIFTAQNELALPIRWIELRGEKFVDFG